MDTGYRASAPTDTIVAIATAIGEAGIAVLRISGPDAVAVGQRIFRPIGHHAQPLSGAATHTVHYGHVVRDGHEVDEVLVSIFRAPRTFTREDVVEISCHGGMLVVRRVLESVLSAGARSAEPGEFTQRAFLNGRLDLAQAEAVADLIHARTDLALTAAREQLAGRLSGRIRGLREDLMGILAHIEAHIDFPDEDISPDTREMLLHRLQKTVVFVDELLATARDGQILRRGIRAAILGRPNAGKSSLLNQLLGHDRAIVSPVPGTTRDTIEETASIRGVPVVFVDTAGLRDSTDALEQEGIRRSREAAERAELIVHVLDGHELLTEDDARRLDDYQSRPRVIVVNKSDLPRRLVLSSTCEAEAVPVSCSTGAGIELLCDTIQKRVWGGSVTAENLPVTINARHQEALHRAHEALVRTIDGLRRNDTLELPAFELRIAANAVGEIVGATSTEHLLDMIFSQFCLGK
ncbi:MAG: tRNA uridine-5-carboxymethylaminomethyl(34) synthesis GTPase MnmE [Pedosphaera sp.]|nr:tRNA uridine-5-carboxymethylaminomethyl(34) synthesis GTPase MnmE [Pedosphaera sp.]